MFRGVRHGAQTEVLCFFDTLGHCCHCFVPTSFSPFMFSSARLPLAFSALPEGTKIENSQAHASLAHTMISLKSEHQSA